MEIFKLMAILLNNSIKPQHMVMALIFDVDYDLETQGHSHLIPHVEIAYNIYIIHMVLNKCNHILVVNDLHIGSNAEVDLGSQNKYRNEFLGSIVFRKVVSCMNYDLLVDKLNFS